MRLIDADKLEKEMYHEAFETDTDLQKWDSGCWIRYKMFENILDKQEIIKAEPVVRCKDCMYNKGEVNKKGFRICSANGMDITDHDYCSWGEQMNDVR